MARRPTHPYTIQWCPTTLVEKTAIKRGWSEDMSILDFVEEYEVENSRTFRTFEEAATFGRAILHDDYFGEVRLAREVITRRFGEDETCDDAVWHIHASDHELDEDEPDYRPDLDCD